MMGINHGAIGRLNHMKFTFKQSWIYKPRKLVKINEKIYIRKDPDILRWGHSTAKNFSVKEAYYL